MEDHNDDRQYAYIQKLEEAARTLEKMKFGDYVEYLKNTKRMLITNFVAGLSRGFGMAIGFTLLGAVAFYFLSKLASKNLPIIGNFITEIVKIVQNNL
ncbi:MAG: DUF5665 domain-containing protein [Xylanivirga thermophila]|jgi:hypothetical protein|uniref:DUF5665 domain-containing protein n=1 Tax=Xylanivirga thermophila TaxID=2496273 RepID=UPI00101D84DE|nr:DUF5665 domain-containing protein [Xylanivirga thermophila]